MSIPRAVIGLAIAAVWAGTASAQVSADRAAAMARLAFMRGVWVGEASGVNPDGSRYNISQTERIGPMLSGDIIVVEGHGYRADGSTAFNAFGVISYDPQSKGFELRSYAQGYAGTFKLTPTADGYVWEIPAGPGVIRYTAIIKDGTWREVGDRVFPNSEPARIFEMNLKKFGETEWPAGSPVPPPHP